MKKVKSVDEYYDQQTRWSEEMNQLRRIVGSLGLDEVMKWNFPVYTLAGKNVLGIGSAKNHFGLWFFQGALLEDKDDVLINAQEGKTKALRQWRFTSKKEIQVRRIKKYVLEAAALAEQGKKINPVRNKPVVIPTELSKALAQNKRVKIAFGKLSQRRRREYADHIADAKRDETKQRRIEKIFPMILASVGLHDKYRNC